MAHAEALSRIMGDAVTVEAKLDEGVLTRLLAAQRRRRESGRRRGGKVSCGQGGRYVFESASGAQMSDAIT
jgi:hypothetical protein